MGFPPAAPAPRREHCLDVFAYLAASIKAILPAQRIVIAEPAGTLPSETATLEVTIDLAFGSTLRRIPIVDFAEFRQLANAHITTERPGHKRTGSGSLILIREEDYEDEDEEVEVLESSDSE